MGAGRATYDTFITSTLIRFPAALVKKVTADTGRCEPDIFICTFIQL